MTTNAFSVNERAPRYSLIALALLADPVSALLDRSRLAAIAAIALRRHQNATCRELTLLRDCYRDLKWLRRKLKQVFTSADTGDDIDVAAAQRLIDRFELWSD
jgi:hypothetical protein